MKPAELPFDPIPKHDYGVALKSAVSWLGDRYLLAAPLHKRNDGRKEIPGEPRRWHEAPAHSSRAQ